MLYLHLEGVSKLSHNHMLQNQAFENAVIAGIELIFYVAALRFKMCKVSSFGISLERPIHTL